jgi:hypothetical protein
MAGIEPTMFSKPCVPLDAPQGDALPLRRIAHNADSIFLLLRGDSNPQLHPAIFFRLWGALPLSYSASIVFSNMPTQANFKTISKTLTGLAAIQPCLLNCTLMEN